MQLHTKMVLKIKCQLSSVNIISVQPELIQISQVRRYEIVDM
ncbi:MULTISPECIES: hypothetical protein [unclassified Microcoleus]|nr:MULTISPECIES: hypothetical protein [unclassified Microcoleus]